MSTAEPTAPSATIELSAVERAVLICEARRAASWCTDRLHNAYPDENEGTDAEAMEIIEAVRANINAAALVINAAMSDEPFEATPAMSGAVAELRDCVVRSCTVNGTWVVDEEDPFAVENREHFDVLGAVLIQLKAACAQVRGPVA